MQVEERTFLKRLDFNFVVTILGLNIIGLIILYSATHGVHLTTTTRLFWQQFFWLIAGWSVFFTITVIDYQFFKRAAYVFYGFNLMALVAVMLFGRTFYGAQRWLDLGFFKYQPSETMKVMIVLVIAKILSTTKAPNGLGVKDLMKPLILTLIPVGLTIKQPDLGTGLLIFAISLSMVLFVKVKKSILIFALISGVIASPLVWSFGLKPYQKQRVLTFLTPGKDPRGTGYNSIQSKIAVGSGKVLGKGFRKGTQSQLEFLPERHTDFIFSVLSEEFGFIGSMSAFTLFIVLFISSLRIAQQAPDKFGALVIVGITALLFWHMFINIGMVIGILPIVGVPLPLLSYGGSSMLTTMGGLGLISGVAYRKYLF